MKRIIIAAMALTLLLALAAAPALAKPGDCVTIQDRVLEYSSTHYLAGELLEVGFDPYGYNYQGHMFSGSYANAYLGGYGFPPYEGDDASYLAANPSVVNVWCWDYRDTRVEMKWNDAWLSNKDCNGDGKLDRHFGFASYIGSGAWETNHMWGGEGADKYSYFVKIVAAPADAYKTAGVWYTADGSEIGPDIWGEFAIIQEVEQGVLYKSPTSAGFGFYAP